MQLRFVLPLLVAAARSAYVVPPDGALWRSEWDKNELFQTGELTDVNGDGLVDIVIAYKTSSVLQQVVYLNSGSSWVNADEYDPARYLTIQCVFGHGDAVKLAFLPTEDSAVLRHSILEACGLHHTTPLLLFSSSGHVVPISNRLSTGLYTTRSTTSTNCTWDPPEFLHSNENSAGDMSTIGYSSMPLADLIDVNGDSLPDYVVSYTTSIAGQGNGLPACKHVYLNTGCGWKCASSNNCKCT